MKRTHAPQVGHARTSHTVPHPLFKSPTRSPAHLAFPSIYSTFFSRWVQFAGPFHRGLGCSSSTDPPDMPLSRASPTEETPAQLDPDLRAYWSYEWFEFGLASIDSGCFRFGSVLAPALDCLRPGIWIQSSSLNGGAPGGWRGRPFAKRPQGPKVPLGSRWTNSL
jgi:hypothetical protein